MLQLSPLSAITPWSLSWYSSCFKGSIWSLLERRKQYTLQVYWCCCGHNLYSTFTCWACSNLIKAVNVPMNAQAGEGRNLGYMHTPLHTPTHTHTHIYTQADARTHSRYRGQRQVGSCSAHEVSERIHCFIWIILFNLVSHVFFSLLM